MNLAEGLEGFFAAAAKLQLVAEPKTALLVNDLVASYGELLIRLMGRAMPLHEKRNDISILDDLYNQAQKQVTRVLGEMTKFNESAQADQLVFGALRRSFDSFQAQADRHSADRAEAWEAFNRLNVDFCRHLLIDLRDISEQQIPVLIEIRRDLGLTADLDVYREQMEKQWHRISPHFDALLEKLQAN